MNSNSLMNEIAQNIILNTRDKRIKYFFSRLNDNFDKFTSITLNGIFCKIPIQVNVPSRKFYKYKLRFPVKLGPVGLIKNRINRTVYDIYKTDGRYNYMEMYLDELQDKDKRDLESIDRDQIYAEFTNTIQFSFIFYMFYSMLEDVVKQGTTINLFDSVFSELTSKFHTKGGQLSVTMTPYPIKTVHSTYDHMYISIFN